MVAKSLTSDADMVILDIEDAVAPSAKDTACHTVCDVLQDWTQDDITVEVTVRINSLGTRGRTDLELLAGAAEMIENVVLPKVTDTGDLERLTHILEQHGYRSNIMPLIETPESFINLPEIAHFPGVEAMEFGAEDFTTELGATTSAERDEVVYARQKLVVAASAADIDAIDMAWPDFRDEDGLRHNTEQAVELGYDGKSAIHPAQIDVIKEVFTPDPEEVERAVRIVEGAANAQEDGKVVFQLDGEMIDPPIIERARNVLDRANDSN